MYKVRTSSTASMLDNQTFAIWVTKFADLVPQVEGGVAAPSVHFGSELWFFRLDQVDKVMKVILRKWHILKTTP